MASKLPKLNVDLCKNHLAYSRLSTVNLVLAINNRSIVTSMQRTRLIGGCSETYFSLIVSGSLNAFGPFSSSRIDLLVLILSRVLRHQCLRRSPSCLTLTLCHCPLRGPLSISTFHTLIPHTK